MYVKGYVTSLQVLIIYNLLKDWEKHAFSKDQNLNLTEADLS